jgi:hypothetical protein
MEAYPEPTEPRKGTKEIELAKSVPEKNCE